jgi:alkanesulfonate monooxygenase SsuD/methylene tetrahydromethanopterin reductase-like flavin-dependent oxidoreductase (luciferase family)
LSATTSVREGQVREDRSRPFGRGSVALRCYTHDDLSGPELVADLRAQARLAEELGFDGIGLGEHHLGFAGYAPNPIPIISWALDATERLWGAANPVLLPLRPTPLVIEDLAWLACRFPGRVGAGAAPGSLDADFELVEVPRSEALARFTSALVEVADALAGRGAGRLAGDPAVEHCAQEPVPLVVAAISPGAARRAAQVGAGLILEPLSPPERIRELVDVYEGAGGSGPRHLVRQVWVGPPPDQLHDELHSRYQSYSAESSLARWGTDDYTMRADEPDELAEALVEVVRAAGATGLDLRVTVPGMTPAQTAHQLRVLGEEVLPRLRHGAADAWAGA